MRSYVGLGFESSSLRGVVGIGLCIFPTAFAFAGWQTGISCIGAHRVLVYQRPVTLAGVISGIVFFREELGIDKLVGGATILVVGVYLARCQGRGGG